eukprot:CAMPEP_0114337120 /NCGR_PEP_ID=MMETSP0101-20121206/6159_1 /TAXON_ID=38822 ORGANISM="Pteridomonas danica, Strain PT" /NCGR_SAMPLE_ID=MMETSP0101 /ASSEMBLY_ACC=CAM_ASM_000211 /LENGTH=173 /DNA_ID=CAMNT_0001469265 /DNA_START=29 /DNA_END=547 /DNA_ORIENTATION=-
MGGGVSRLKTPHQSNPVEPQTDENDNDEFYATSEEEAFEIRTRMAKYEEDKQKRIAAKALSRQRLREAAEDKMAIKLLATQLENLIKSKQLTTEYQKGKFGVVDYNNNRFYLPNRKFDYDRIEVKNIDMSRGNDLNRPEPVVVSCTFDWTNSVQKVMGTAHESYEAIWMGDMW